MLYYNYKAPCKAIISILLVFHPHVHQKQMIIDYYANVPMCHNVEKLGISESDTSVIYGLAMMQIEPNLVHL